MIVLIGATGFTGRLVAAELKRLGADVRLAGRDPGKVEELRASLDADFDVAQVDVARPETIKTALEGAHVVLSCAGPFADVGEPVVQAAVDAGAHYLDTTGEQNFIKLVFDRYGAAAREKGIVLVPGCAFEYALGDAAASLAARDFAGCKEIEIVYSIEGTASSRGTRKSVMRALSAPGYLLRGGAPVVVNTASVSRRLEVPRRGARRAYSFPGGEVFMVPLHIPVADLTTSMVLDAPRPVVSLFSRLGPAILRSRVAEWLSRRIDRGQFGPTLQQRHATRFWISCRARSQQEEQTVTIEGEDPYGLTALVAAGAARAMEEEEFQGRGPTSPSQVAGADAIRSSTETAGTKWQT